MISKKSGSGRIFHFLFSLFFVGLCHATQPTWIEVGQDKKYITYIDTANIRKSQDDTVILVWVADVAKTDNTAVKNITVIFCEGNEYSIEYVKLYSDYKNKIVSTESKLQFIPRVIRPGTLIDTISMIVCSR